MWYTQKKITTPPPRKFGNRFKNNSIKSTTPRRNLQCEVRARTPVSGLCTTGRPTADELGPLRVSRSCGLTTNRPCRLRVSFSCGKSEKAWQNGPDARRRCIPAVASRALSVIVCVHVRWWPRRALTHARAFGRPRFASATAIENHCSWNRRQIAYCTSALMCNFHVTVTRVLSRRARGVAVAGEARNAGSDTYHHSRNASTASSNYGVFLLVHHRRACHAG